MVHALVQTGGAASCSAIILSRNHEPISCTPAAKGQSILKAVMHPQAGRRGSLNLDVKDVGKAVGASK
jgi:hypothetical protein